MCCFSLPVQSVARTKIFARGVPRSETQLLAYQMSFTASRDLAMVLPLPVPRRSREDAVSFVNLERYPRLFDDLDRAFPQMMTFGAVSGAIPQPAARAAPLVVHDVGAFEASFVPTVADFDRLDPRFRIPEGVWDELPLHRDYGFAVFKLEATRGARRKVHPMAFAFPRRDPRVTFFPTLHVHDGRVHRKAHFDHELYLQSDVPPEGWDESMGVLGSYVESARAQGLIDAALPGYRLKLAGARANEDVVVGAAS